MEYSPKQGEPFDHFRYWNDRMEKLTSNEMSNVSRNRARLYREASEKVQGRPPALTSGIIDTLMGGGYPTKEEVENWITSKKITGTNQLLEKNSLKHAADVFEAAGRPMGGVVDD
jgi:hypothetical protein